MAVTKILARKGRLDVGVRYVLNGDKTQEQILTARLNCEPGREVRQMLETKQDYGKEGGVQYYHMIQSFRPGEIIPELALEIAKEFVSEHLPGYQTVIGVHVDKEHIHAHILFNSVNADTGEKYHSNARSYYRQIRAISDRLCEEHGLSVIVRGEPSKAVSYIEWLRQSRGQATFRSMLEADLREAIQDANDLGHFFLLMEHKGYEIRHGNRLGFRLRGQDRFMIPGRKNPLFTEDGIRAAIQGNLSAIEAGRRPAVPKRTAYGDCRDDEGLDFLESRPFTTLFVAGNHENYDALRTYPLEDWHGGKIRRIRPSVLLLERGQVFDLNGKRIFTMGGASSHDIQGGILEPDDPLFLLKFHTLKAKGTPFRVNHRSWWKEELPSPEEYLEARQNLNKAGWEVDYIITHCAPTSIQNELLRERSKPDELTDFLEEVRQRCRFRYHFFGHYHGDGIIQNQFVLLYKQILRLK